MVYVTGQESEAPPGTGIADLYDDGRRDAAVRFDERTLATAWD
jgi:hypothetical protein